MVTGKSAIIFSKAIMGFCIPGWKWYWISDLCWAMCPYFWCILRVLLKISDSRAAAISNSATFMQTNDKRLCLTVDICFTRMNHHNVINRNVIIDRLSPQLDIRYPVDVTTDLQKTILSACNPLFLSCAILNVCVCVCRHCLQGALTEIESSRLLFVHTFSTQLKIHPLLHKKWGKIYNKMQIINTKIAIFFHSVLK